MEGESFAEFKRRNRKEQHQIVIEESKSKKKVFQKKKDYLKKKHEKSKKTKEIDVVDKLLFNNKDHVKFGEVAERPPEFTIVPKKKKFVSRFKFHNSTDI